MVAHCALSAHTPWPSVGRAHSFSDGKQIVSLTTKSSENSSFGTSPRFCPKQSNPPRGDCIDFRHFLRLSQVPKKLAFGTIFSPVHTHTHTHAQIESLSKQIRIFFFGNDVVTNGCSHFSRQLASQLNTQASLNFDLTEPSIPSKFAILPHTRLRTFSQTSFSSTSNSHGIQSVFFASFFSSPAPSSLSSFRILIQNFGQTQFVLFFDFHRRFGRNHTGRLRWAGQRLSVHSQHHRLLSHRFRSDFSLLHAHQSCQGQHFLSDFFAIGCIRRLRSSPFQPIDSFRFHSGSADRSSGHAWTGHGAVCPLSGSSHLVSAERHVGHCQPLDVRMGYVLARTYFAQIHRSGVQSDSSHLLHVTPGSFFHVRLQWIVLLRSILALLYHWTCG